MTATLQIVELDLGLQVAYVGMVEDTSDGIAIRDAYAIRRSGTDSLASLAQLGPQTASRLNAADLVLAPADAVVERIDCDPEAWTDLFPQD